MHDVDGVLNQFTTEEYLELMAAEQLDGILSDERLVRTIALVGYYLCQSWGSKIPISAFLPDEDSGEVVDGEIQVQNPEDQISIARTMAAAQNANF